VRHLTGPGGAGVTVSEATAQMFDPADPDRPVKAFLQEYQTLFGFGPEALDDANVQRDDVSAGNGVRTVVWQQQVAGVPVFDVLLIGHITSAGELACLSSELIPSPAQAADPAMLALVQSGADLPLSSPLAIIAAGLTERLKVKGQRKRHCSFSSPSTCTR
jgi:Fungalysin/Thermolysin Propeptide Motif